MRHWFLPDMPDLLALLRDQAHITRQGLAHFVDWANGDPDSGALVRDAEHEADTAKRAVRTALRNAFSTPLDPEDIYELSERTDAVMNAVKNIVREAEVLATAPDAHMATMAAALRDGQAHLCTAIGALGHDDDEATRASDDAIDCCRDVEHVYRAAMSDLLALDDLRQVIASRELYRRFSRTADAVELVAERVWYAVVKSA
jgi:uncharacterized protein Yka (UPF0111/DUF47 family)